MAKKAFRSLLLTTLPLSAALVSCSTGGVAENAHPENAGAHSTMHTSAPLPPVPSDAELEQQSADAGASSETKSPYSESFSESGNMDVPHHSKSSTANDDPYLPPQAYIPPAEATTEPQPTTSPETTTSTSPSSTAGAPSTPTSRVAAPKPSKPIPLLPDGGANGADGAVPTPHAEPNPGTTPTLPGKPDKPSKPAGGNATQGSNSTQESNKGQTTPSTSLPDSEIPKLEPDTNSPIKPQEPSDSDNHVGAGITVPEPTSEQDGQNGTTQSGTTSDGNKFSDGLRDQAQRVIDFVNPGF